MFEYPYGSSGTTLPKHGKTSHGYGFATNAKKINIGHPFFEPTKHIAVDLRTTCDPMQKLCVCLAFAAGTEDSGVPFIAVVGCTRARPLNAACGAQDCSSMTIINPSIPSPKHLNSALCFFALITTHTSTHTTLSSLRRRSPEEQK